MPIRGHGNALKCRQFYNSLTLPQPFDAPPSTPNTLLHRASGTTAIHVTTLRYRDWWAESVHLPTDCSFR